MDIEKLRLEARKRVLGQFTYKIQTKRILSLFEDAK
jgi:hypothetical protein